jgi:hypothetical protein
MHRLIHRSLGVAAIAVLALGGAATVEAAVTSYGAFLSGPAEFPPNASPGTGFTQVDIDPVAHTMRVRANFTGLTGNTTASHIHAATTLPGTGTAGVATTTPTFAAFPLGVTSGTYDNTLDMTLASSYNPAYITAHGANIAQAETDLFAAIANGQAYLNIHSSTFGGGEIRGFLVPLATPAEPTSWGRLRAMYRE